MRSNYVCVPRYHTYSNYMSLQNTTSNRATETVNDSTAGSNWRDAFTAASLVETVGFWLAVTLPIPTVLLLAGGVSTILELATVGGLFAANLLAFYLGHEYSINSA